MITNNFPITQALGEIAEILGLPEFRQIPTEILFSPRTSQFVFYWNIYSDEGNLIMEIHLKSNGPEEFNFLVYPMVYGLDKVRPVKDPHYVTSLVKTYEHLGTLHPREWMFDEITNLLGIVRSKHLTESKQKGDSRGY